MAETVPPPATRAHRRRATAIVARALVLATLVACGIAAYYWRTHPDTKLPYPGGQATCPELLAPRYLEVDNSPYGQLRSCRQLAARQHLTGALDVEVWVLLATATGAVALRVEYRDLDLGRQFRVEAFELSSSQAPNLAAAERQDVHDSSQLRGGVRTTPWVLHYGDG